MTNNLVQVDPRSVGFYGKSYEEIKNRPEALATRLDEVLKDTPKHVNGFGKLVEGSSAKRPDETLDEARARAANERRTELENARKIHPDYDKMTNAMLQTMNVEPDSYNYDTAPVSKGGVQV